MRLALAAALVMALIPATVAAQDTVCTQVVGPDGVAEPVDPAILFAGPEDGDCDTIVYLPPVMVDGLLCGQVSEVVRNRLEAEWAAERAAREAEERAEATAAYATTPCEELHALFGAMRDDSQAVLDEWARRCGPNAVESVAPDPDWWEAVESPATALPQSSMQGQGRWNRWLTGRG
jgi:hypothetical protein